MQLFETIGEYLNRVSTYRSTMDLGDMLEILIIAILVYYILAWMKTTRSWRLLKGLIVIAVFLMLAALMEMTTITWIAKNVLGFAVTAFIVIMQPELRHALEQLGQKNFLPSLFGFSESSKREVEEFSERSLGEIVRACVEMGKVRTGALIVIEKKESLKDYERTGIEVDGVVSSQLLVNIFEHNTPLHDGAVIVRGNRITYATCYLPLSDNLGLSKELGTRHRAAVGISEASDSLTIVVSEETGKISVAHEGELSRNLNAEQLRDKMRLLMNMNEEQDVKPKRKRKGRSKAKDEKTDIA